MKSFNTLKLVFYNYILKMNLKLSKTLFSILFLIGFFSCKKTETTCLNSIDIDSCPDQTITIDSNKINRNVLVIGIDGFRSDALLQITTPFMYQLSQNNHVFFNGSNRVEDHTVSGPNWTSLTTGVHWCKHQVINNDFSDNQLTEYPHFFSYIESAYPSIQTTSIVNWTPINEHITKSLGDYAPQNSLNDAEVFQLASDMLSNQNSINPDVLFLQFDELDGAGHSYGFSSDVTEYAQCLNQTDQYVEQLFSLIENKRNNGEDWMIFIVSDHGGDGTSHSNGQQNEHIINTIFFAQHPTLSFDSSHSSTQVDLVASILDYMGIYSAQFDCKKDGISFIQ